MNVFRPILVGATPRDRAVACVGALFGISATGLISRAILGHADLAMLLAAPLGASAVLLFVVPASPMAQPWPVIGGNVVSALAGVIAATVVPNVWDGAPMIAAGVAVALSIALMSLARCLHPSGGGTALVAALGGPAYASHDWAFALMPVGLNAVVLVTAAWLFHRFSGHSYPHVPAPPAEPLQPVPVPHAITDADIDRALAMFGEPLDVSRADLRTLIDLAQRREGPDL